MSEEFTGPAGPSRPAPSAVRRSYDATVPADRALVEQVRAGLRAAGDPARAAGQQAYMRSALPFHGVTAAGVREVLRPLLAEAAPVAREDWEATVRLLWDGATHREERYAAIGVARHRTARPWRDPASLPLWRHLVVTGAWWDLVDDVATHLVGEVLARHREAATPVVRRWASDPDPWLRRTAVLAQVGHRDATDTALLAHAVEANLDDGSSWLRKAIGWALRDLARTDPAWVREHVAGWGGRLSPLSRREALKHLLDHPG